MVENVSERTLDRNYILSLLSNSVTTETTVTYSFPQKNDQGTIYDGAQIVATQDDATHASEDATLAFKTMVAGTQTTNIQMTGNKLSFFNTTPVTKRTGIADVDASTVDNTYGQQENDVITSLRTKLNAVLQILEDYGLTTVA